MAGTHFRIEKSVSGGRTFTEVRPLSMDERREEVARMIGGADVTELTLQNAGEMLRLARENA